MTPEKFPLTWPQGYPVTERREYSKFDCTMAEARDGIISELTRLKATDVLISTNVQVDKRGMIPASGRLVYANPGVAVYFRFQGEDKVIACDKWCYLHENLRAVQKSIEAIRGLERWGCTDIISRAMGDMKALGSATGVTIGKVKRPWEDVLDVPAHSSTAMVKHAYRMYAKLYHPDNHKTGDEYKFQEVQEAYDEFKNERGL